MINIRRSAFLRLAVCALLAMAIAASLFSCKTDTPSVDSESVRENLPTDAADTVTDTESSAPETTEPATETQTGTEADTEPVETGEVETKAPETKAPETKAPETGAPESSVSPAPVEPVHPTVSTDPDGTLNTHANVKGLTAAQNEFISSTVFVGDSICSGLEAYGVLPDDNVIAATSNSVHDIDRYQVTVGGASYDYVSALKVLNPKTVIFFMGMNDTYLSAAAYCQNYTAILGKVHAALPNARLYVASITPISASCTYTTNANIDNFNAQIRSTVASIGYGYVDISTVLKGDNNCLRPEYSGGDGIHVPGAAYYEIVSSVCAQLAP